MPAALILRFARVRRWLIVGSGTRNARAISSVVTPPRVRKVSATCDSTDNAGWQHMKISSSRSSGNVVGAIGSSCGSAASSRAFVANVRSRRMRSIARFRAVLTSHVPGFVGTPSRGHRSTRRRRPRLCGFLGEIDVAEEADQGREHVAPTLAEDLLERRLVYHSTIGRTSTAPPSRAAGTRDASSIAASRSSASNSR